MESSPQVSSWLMFSLPELSTRYKLYILPQVMPLLFPLMNILLTGGLINLLCLCLEVHHQWSSDRGPMFALARYLLPSAIFSTVCNIPKCLLMKTVQHEGYIVSLDDSLSCSLCRMLVVAPTSLRLSRDHVYVILSNTATTGLIPFLTWTALICTSIKKLNKSIHQVPITIRFFQGQPVHHLSLQSLCPLLPLSFLEDKSQYIRS